MPNERGNQLVYIFEQAYVVDFPFFATLGHEKMKNSIESMERGPRLRNSKIDLYRVSGRI